MARGFIGGIVIGGVFSVVVAGIVSFVVPIGPPPQMDDTAPQDMTAAAPVDTPPEPPAPAPVDSPPEAKPAPLAIMPADDSSADAPQDMATAPLAAPEIGQDIEITRLNEAIETTPPAMTPDAPILPNPMALAPMEPDARDDTAIETDSVAPVPVITTAPDADEPIAAETVVVDPVPQDDVMEETAPGVEETAPEVITAKDTAPENSVTVEIPATPAEEPQTETSKPDMPTTVVVEAAPVTKRPTVLDVPVPTEAPSIDTAASKPRGAAVTVNRLPTALSGEQTDAAVQQALPSGAITRYGQPFANPDDKPLMGILLIDQGSDLDGGEVGIAALRSFPYPISFAVDVDLPDAAERMTIYRNEGFEVLAMVDLPDSAQASDAETTLAVALTRLPEVIGVLEGQGNGLQPDRALADQVTAILAEGGHGLVTQDKGLNTMPKLAIKEGVPAAAIFRDFDSKDQTPTVIRRFLDQAAFKAGIEGSVIMLGRMRPETISALLVWGLQDRASQVALAPISAVLLAEEAE